MAFSWAAAAGLKLYVKAFGLVLSFLGFSFVFQAATVLFSGVSKTSVLHLAAASVLLFLSEFGVLFHLAPNWLVGTPAWVTWLEANVTHRASRSVLYALLGAVGLYLNVVHHFNIAYGLWNCFFCSLAAAVWLVDHDRDETAEGVAEKTQLLPSGTKKAGGKTEAAPQDSSVLNTV